MSTSGAAAASTSRSRPQNRRKPADDLAYIAPSSSATKRQAQDRAEGEPRQKRKKVDQSLLASVTSRKIEASRDAGKLDGEEPPSVNFTTFSTETLHRYLTYYDIIPLMHTSPLFAHDPPPPSSLEHPPSPAILSPNTPANRPRRDPKEGRRRSSRFLEEDIPRTPILLDTREVNTVLAHIAERHFQETAVTRELDTIALFMTVLENTKRSRQR